ncbi:MAG: hypothetical protein IH946_03505, partial [Bacteroidetes bacterium]|nr:hypothetical protein [Bacteroidota bacterium]
MENSIIKVLLTHWKPLLFIVVVSTAVGLYLTFTVPHNFSSTVIFYSANPKVLTPKEYFSPEFKMAIGSSQSHDFLVMSLARSTEMQDYLIDELDLYEHYNISQ